LILDIASDKYLINGRGYRSLKPSFNFLKRIKVRIALSFSLLFLIVAVPAIIYAFNQVNLFFEGMFLQQMKVAGLTASALSDSSTNIDSLTNNISKITETSVFLIGKDGRILSHHSGESLPDSAILLSMPIENRAADTLNPTPHRFIRIANRRYLQVQTMLPNDDRLLMVKSFNRVSILKARMREVIFWSSFLGLVALIAVAFWVSANITKSLETLTVQAGKIRLGGSPEKTEITSPDEVGELAEALNGIVDNLNRAKFDLTKMEKTQRDFYGQIGERLERPLLTIKNQLNSIIDSPNSIDKENKERLGQAVLQTGRVQQIIHTLIEISQLEYGEKTLKPTPVQMASLMQAAAARFENDAIRKGLRFETICKPDDLTVLADENYLKVALENLISNAIDFTDQGFIKIKCEGSGSIAAIRVEDSGCGIPQSQIDRIFDRFWRVEPYDSDNRAGLGLAMVREIIKAHGQKLEVISQLGVGSHFSFYLPRACDEA
jgi:signal transduction histidine kinase